MTVAAASSAVAFNRASLRRIVAAGLAGGAVDFVYACAVGLSSGRSIQRVWQGVANGLIGKPAMEMGWVSSALGMAIHFTIATIMAAAFAIAADRMPGLYRRPWIAGVLYGLVLYGVMYGIVLPLRWPTVFPNWSGLSSVLDVLAHVGVGLAIVFVLRGRHRSAL
jgi:hypothetical protein